MSSLQVVPNFIASFHSNPLRNGTILFLLLGQESLDPESLVRRHGEDRPQPHIGWQRREKSPFFFLKITLAIRGFLYFHTNCEIICSSSVKNTVGRLIGIALNL